MHKPIFIIFGIILSLTFSFGLFFYLFGADIPAQESYWEVVNGKNKVSKFEEINYDLAKKAPSGETLIELVRFNTNNKNYDIKLSVSDLKSLKRLRFGRDYMDKKSKGWHTIVYYSGIMHFKIVDLSQPTQPLVELKKTFKDWDYPIKSQGKKFTKPSIISSFGKLYFLPDSRPCVMLSSPVYQGRVYQHKNSVGDETFSLIIP